MIVASKIETIDGVEMIVPAEPIPAGALVSLNGDKFEVALPGTPENAPVPS